MQPQFDKIDEEGKDIVKDAKEPEQTGTNLNDTLKSIKSKANVSITQTEEEIDVAALAQYQNELSTDLYAKLRGNAKQKEIQKELESEANEDTISF